MEQLTYLLFLKMADERTRKPYKQKSIVPDDASWQSLLKRDGDDLFDHYRHTGLFFGPDRFHANEINTDR